MEQLKQNPLLHKDHPLYVQLLHKDHALYVLKVYMLPAFSKKKINPAIYLEKSPMWKGGELSTVKRRRDSVDRYSGKLLNSKTEKKSLLVCSLRSSFKIYKNHYLLNSESYYIKLGSSKLLINMIATHNNYIFKIVTCVNLSHN